MARSLSLTLPTPVSVWGPASQPASSQWQCMVFFRFFSSNVKVGIITFCFFSYTKKTKPMAEPQHSKKTYIVWTREMDIRLLVCWLNVQNNWKIMESLLPTSRIILFENMSPEQWSYPRCAVRLI